MEYLEQFAHIAYTVIGPIVLLAGAGYVLGRMVEPAATVLAKILLYILIPVYVFYNILRSSLGQAEAGSIVAFSGLALVGLYVAAQAASRLRRHDAPLRGAFTNTAILYNSANFGIPVLALAFSFDPDQEAYAVACQIIVATCQGFAAYTFGAFIAAAGAGGVGHAMKKVFQLPFIYALAIALALKGMGVTGAAMREITIVWRPLTILSDSYVAVALMTLGAQMATVRLVRMPVDLALSMGVRLLIGPLLGLALVFLLGIEGQLARILVIGVSGPSAVAGAVLAIEFRNRPDFAASAVFVSTLGAGLTVPIVIFLVRTLL
jgi:hypothetical protein